MLLFLEVIEIDSQKKRFEEIYSLFLEPMTIMAQSILHNAHDAEDAVHNVFLNIATKRIAVLDELSDNNDMKYYLLTAVKNAAINIQKHNNRLLSIDDISNRADVLKDESFVDTLYQRLEYEELIRMIRSMPSPYKEVMYYHFGLEMTAGTISRVTGRPISTVKKQLVRGKKIILKQFEGRQSDDDKR